MQIEHIRGQGPRVDREGGPAEIVVRLVFAPSPMAAQPHQRRIGHAAMEPGRYTRLPAKLRAVEQDLLEGVLYDVAGGLGITRHFHRNRREARLQFGEHRTEAVAVVKRKDRVRAGALARCVGRGAGRFLDRRILGGVQSRDLVPEWRGSLRDGVRLSRPESYSPRGAVTPAPPRS